jgi:peptide/nickel transport system permease protein
MNKREDPAEIKDTPVSSGKNQSAKAPTRISEFQRFRSVFFGRRVVIVGFVIIFILIFVAIFAGIISPYNPYKQDLKNTLQKPSAEHWLGTDPYGRDVLSRVIYGSRTSLMVGIVAVGIGATVGILLGLVSGYFGSAMDIVLMRIIDAMMAVPSLVLALVFAAVLGSGLTNVMIAIGIAMVPLYCRLMRGQVLTIRQADYVLAAHSLGCSYVRIMFRHVLPNCMPPLIVLMTLNLGTSILAEAGLSFIGVGILPPGAAWGSMINQGYNYLLTNPILSFAPGVCIMLVVLSFNMVGDGLRDALDPRLRGII